MLVLTTSIRYRSMVAMVAATYATYKVCRVDLRLEKIFAARIDARTDTRTSGKFIIKILVINKILSINPGDFGLYFSREAWNMSFLAAFLPFLFWAVHQQIENFPYSWERNN